MHIVLVPVIFVTCYLFIRALCSLLSLIYFVHCKTLFIRFVVQFSSSSILLLFIIYCALFYREKFNSDPGLCPGISIPLFQ